MPILFIPRHPRWQSLYWGTADLTFWVYLLIWCKTFTVLVFSIVYVFFFAKEQKKKREHFYLLKTFFRFMKLLMFLFVVSVGFSIHWRWLLDEPWIFSISIKIFKSAHSSPQYRVILKPARCTVTYICLILHVSQFALYILLTFYCSFLYIVF